MKKLILIIVLAFFIQSTLSSQSCLPDGITFTTQTEIDNFQTNYPNCNEIEGDMTINGNDITSLNGLSFLTSIGGDLFIHGNNVLPSLTGLENLTSISSDLWIFNNTILSGLGGLNNIDAESITNIYIRYNPLLSYCDILSICDYLTSPNGTVTISNNYSGCNTEEEILAACEIQCPVDFTFITQAQIDNFQTNYPNCTEIEGFMTISGEGITNLNGLSVITSVGGNLNIGYYSNHNANLTDLTGLNNVTSIGGNLWIYANSVLTNLTGLNNLTSIGGDLRIRFNSVLSGLAGLDNIEAETIANIYISDNPLLQYCDVQSICDYLLSPNGAVYFSSNAVGCNSEEEVLTACDYPCPVNITFNGQSQIDFFQTNYPDCTEIEGDLTIDGDNITSLIGLSVLTSIGGDLIINETDSMTSLTGLEGLTFIGGDLTIVNNNELTSLTGLDYIEANSITDLHITNNVSLSSCEAQGICNYLSNPNGIVNIYSNAPGCNNPPEVANACGFTMPCLPYGNYYFFTQTDIDIFQTNYPNCTSIEGDVHIKGNDITNLNGLNVVTSIGGNLSIGDYSNNPNLTSLTGLDNVTSIGGDLSIKYGDSLTTLTGLNNLSSIGGNLRLYNNYAMTTLSGLDNVTYIGGDLTISYYNWGGNTSVLTSLTGLENVASVGGNLLIDNCDALTSMTGLESLTTIGGDLGIGPTMYIGYELDAGSGRNASLTSLTGLDNLTSIGGDLRINDNDALTSLTGLDNVTSIGGNVLLFYNDIMASLTGLGNITTIMEDLIIYGNSALINLTGLDNVTSIDGNLWIGKGYIQGNNDNINLTNLLGLDNLNTVGGDLIVGSNLALTSLTGLENLSSIGGNLSFGYYNPDWEGYLGNPSLNDLTGLDKLTSIGEGLSFFSNNNLTSLTGLDNLTSLSGSLSVEGNFSLASLSGLDNISASSITDLYITNNNSLSSCEVQGLCDYLANPNGTVNVYNNSTGCNYPPEIADACGITIPCLPYGNYYFFTQTDIDVFQTIYPNCSNLEGRVQISGDSITNLNGLYNVISFGGDLSIRGNYLLKSLSGLDNVTSINGNLEIGGNGLTSLSGLGGLTSTGGAISINSNGSLTSLTELGNVSSIGGDLHISWNGSLTTLEGIDNIDATSIDGLTIFRNTNLSTCEVESICNYLDSPNGATNINYNAQGCAHRYQIVEACVTVSVDEVHSSDKLFIYPNPSSTQITLQLPNTPQTNTVLAIYNLNGQQLILHKITEQKTVVDISGLRNGIYFLKVADDKTMMVGKMVKN